MNTFSIKNRSDYIKSLSENEINKGLVRIYIPDPDSVVGGETVWGYLEPSENLSTKRRFKIILLNDSFCYLGFLHWGMKLCVKKKEICYLN